MKNKQNKTSYINIRITEEEKEAFAKMCDKKDSSIAFEVRRFIRSQIKGQIVSKSDYVPKYRRNG